MSGKFDVIRVSSFNSSASEEYLNFSRFGQGKKGSYLFIDKDQDWASVEYMDDSYLEVVFNYFYKNDPDFKKDVDRHVPGKTYSSLEEYIESGDFVETIMFNTKFFISTDLNFDYEPYDPGDWYTPPSGGSSSLLEVYVLSAGWVSSNDDSIMLPVTDPEVVKRAFDGFARYNKGWEEKLTEGTAESGPDDYEPPEPTDYDFDRAADAYEQSFEQTE